MRLWLQERFFVLLRFDAVSNACLSFSVLEAPQHVSLPVLNARVANG
jgi:hypothetical protein